MGCQSQGVEVSAKPKECLGLQRWELEVRISCEGMGVRKILWVVQYFLLILMLQIVQDQYLRIMHVLGSKGWILIFSHGMTSDHGVTLYSEVSGCAPRFWALNSIVLTLKYVNSIFLILKYWPTKQRNFGTAETCLKSFENSKLYLRSCTAYRNGNSHCGKGMT